MQHGSDHYFRVTRASRRRVSLLSMAVGVSGLVLLWIPSLPPVSRFLRDNDIVRFGFEGPDRYVPVVHLEAVQGDNEPLVNVGGVRPIASRRGGGPEPKPSSRPKSEAPSRRSNLRGPGEDDHDLMARALADQGRVPIMQSTELIIETLVRPDYPEMARAQGIEGKVAVIALVDTIGQVVDAEVTTGSGERSLDTSALQAVRKCVFRPYRVDGEVREVYALFRFAFRIY